MGDLTGFGERVKARRKTLGMNQGDLAAAAALTQAAVSRYESGENHPTAEALCDLARALQTSTDWLLGLTNNVSSTIAPEESTLSDNEREAIQMLRSNNSDDQEVMLNVWRVLRGYRPG